MFITCNTFRQAAWAPDQYSTGLVTASFSTSAHRHADIFDNFGFTTTTGAGQTTRISTSTTVSATDSTLVSHSTNQIAQSVMNIPVGSVSTVGSTSGGTTSQFDVTEVAGTATTNQYSTASVVVSRKFDTISNVSTITMRDLKGTTALASTFHTQGSYSTSRGLLFSTANTSSSSSGATTTSTTSASGTTAAIPGTSLATTVTTTNTVTIANTVSTTATSTLSRWTVAGGTATPTSVTTTSQSTIFGTVTITAATTTTLSTATPSWWGWSSEIGLVLIATANALRNDLPAWLDVSNYTTGIPPGLWNWAFPTQTTIWPAAPTASAHGGATTQFSALATTTSMSILSTAAFTLFGTSSFSTTFTTTTADTSANALSVFTATGQVSTAGIPIALVKRTIISYSTFTATVTSTFLHPLNTTTSTTTTNSGPVPVTKFLGNSIGVMNAPAVLATFVSTVTATTLVNGYTTASIASGLGGSTSLVSTVILSGPGLSLTTTTITAAWFYDWSCPTVTVSLTSASASASGTTVTLTAFSSNTTSSSSMSTNGRSADFTQNLFAAPALISNAVIYGSSIGGGVVAAVIAPGAAIAWHASPSMQAFSPWTAESVTYQNVSAPAAVTALPFLALESGSYVSVDAIGRAVTTTSTGLWAFAPSPLTSTYSTTSTASATTTAGMTTATTTVSTSTALPTVTAYTFGYSSADSTASTTNVVQVWFPTNMNQAAASIYSSGSTSTTTSSTSSSASSLGITFVNAITSTFCESYGYVATSTVSQLITTTTQFTFTFLPTSATFITTSQNFFTTTFAAPFTAQWQGASPFAFATGLGTAQFFHGLGGVPKVTSQAATIFAIGAAVSLWGTGSTTWSSADPNFFQVVIGAKFTTTSSTTSDLGAGAFKVYTIPGEASIITSPAPLVTTQQNWFLSAATTATAFWLLPDPFLVPNQRDWP